MAMPKQLLHRPHVRSVVQQMRGERMADHMGINRRIDRSLFHAFAEYVADAAVRQRISSAINE